MDQDRIRRESAATEAVMRELERAGLFGNDQVDRRAIIAALLDGPQGDPHKQSQLDQFNKLLAYGHPDANVTENHDPVFGQSALDLRNQMRKGYEGRGWSQQDVDRAGRLPKPRELSPGSRQFQEIDRRFSLLRALSEAHDTKNYGSMSGPSTITRAEHQLPAVAEFDRTRDQKFGESGWLGALENPEYTAGMVMNNAMNPLVDRLQYMTHDGDNWMDSQTHRDELADALAASRAVSPLLPYDPQTPEAKEEAYKKVKGMADAIRPKTYDQAYREKHGHYPSFAGSQAVNFLENLLDPQTVMFGAAGLGKAAASAYAKGTAKAAARAAGGFGQSLLRNNAEEVPMYAGIVGGSYAANPDAVQALPKNWLHDGNSARTDLYTQDEATGQYRKQTPGEFKASMAGKQLEQMEARHNLEEWKRNTPKAPYAKQ